MRHDDQLSTLVTTVSQDNVLPLLSSCNCSCLFCSNKQNPSRLETISISPLELSDTEDLMEFLDPDKKIIIGESASRITEGEPLCHPCITEILTIIRSRFIEATLQLTTNGCLLTEELILLFKDLEPIELNVSINAVTPSIRSRLMGKSAEMDMMTVLDLLYKYNLTYHGSIVAMPHITGYGELTDTIYQLIERGATSIRIFLPGVTDWTAKQYHLAEDDKQTLITYIEKLNCKTNIPIFIEPPELKNLTVEIRGVMLGSPADKAGLITKDIINKVNGDSVVSRVDAYERLTSAGDPELEISRDETHQLVRLNKSKGEKPGIAVDYDINPKRASRLIDYLDDHLKRGINSYVFTSELGYPLLKNYLINTGRESYVSRLCPVINNYFGGNIRCAGLLVMDDFESMITSDIDIAIMPKQAFSESGKDLLGRHYLELYERYNIIPELL